MLVLTLVAVTGAAAGLMALPVVMAAIIYKSESEESLWEILNRI